MLSDHALEFCYRPCPTPPKPPAGFPSFSFLLPEAKIIRAMIQYLDLLRHVMEQGKFKADRTGTGTPISKPKARFRR